MARKQAHHYESQQILEATLSQNAFFMVNKTLIRCLGWNAAIVLADLISKRAYFRSRGELQSDGSFFNPFERIAEDTCLGRNAVIKAVDNLKKVGILGVERRGLPAVNYYTVKDEKVLQLLQSFRNGTTGSTESGRLDVWKRDANKNTVNKKQKMNPEDAESNFEKSNTEGNASTLGSIPVKKSDGHDKSLLVRAQMDRLERALDVSGNDALDPGEIAKLQRLHREKDKKRNGLLEDSLRWLERIEEKLDRLGVLKDACTRAESRQQEAEEDLGRFLADQRDSHDGRASARTVENLARQELGNETFALAVSRYSLQELAGFARLKFYEPTKVLNS